MAELTSSIQESYDHLREKAIVLQQRVSQLGDQPTIQALVDDLLNTQLTSDTLTNQEVLNKLKFIDAYLTVLRVLLGAIQPKSEEWNAIGGLCAELQAESQALKARLVGMDNRQAMTSSNGIPAPDDCLLGFITDATAKTLTQTLLSQPGYRLEGHQIKAVITAWNQAVQAFIEDARQSSDTNGKIQPGKPETLADFFCIRRQLVTLYDRLSFSVA